MAPVFVLLPGLAEWPPGDKRALTAAIRAKGGPSEFEYVERINGTGRLQKAFHALTARRNDTTV
jgi:hypothetical protein